MHKKFILQILQNKTKKVVLSLHYNNDNSYLFLNGVQQTKFKAKNSEISRKDLFCLGNVSIDFSISNIQKTGLYGNVYDFSVDYWPISTNKIYDIHRFLMVKHDIV